MHVVYKKLTFLSSSKIEISEKTLDDTDRRASKPLEYARS